jgi:plastocyanin
MFRRTIAAAVTIVAGFAAHNTVLAQRADDVDDVVIVRMVDKSATAYVFEPESVTVVPGQTIRFVQTGVVPHNVEFRDGPDGTALGADAMGPFLLSAGETYEVIIDERFAIGTHKYVCTPHEIMGMVGTVTVEAAAH